MPIVTLDAVSMAYGHVPLLDAASLQIDAGERVSMPVARNARIDALHDAEANGDLEIAVAQVTRVTDRGASAIVLQVRQGGVVVGMRAQVSAKMP